MGMKTRLILLVSFMGLMWAAHAQKYQLDVDTKTAPITSFLVDDLNDVVCKNNKTIINLTDKTAKEYDNSELLSIALTEYKGSRAQDADMFVLDENHGAVVTPDYSITFFAGCITKSTKLIVSKVSDAPKLLEVGEDDGVAYDFKLDGQSQLDGIAEIRLPIKVGEGDMVFVAYYNQDTKDWEPVNNSYDESTSEVVFNTNHFSLFKAFRVRKEEGKVAVLELLDKEKLASCLAKPKISYATLAGHLERIAQNDNPEAEALETFAGQYSDLSQIGLDIGFNALQSLGLESEFLGKFSDLLGHLGTALSVYQICRNDFRGEDAQVAGNTLKLCLTQVSSKLTSACSSSIMLASMASVAIIDYSLNKFATEGWKLRKDIYQRGYDLFLEKRGLEWWQWRDKLRPYFKSRRKITNEELHQLIDDMVTDYCNMPWTDYVLYSEYCSEANDGMTFSYSGGDDPKMERDISAAKRKELYNYDIPKAVEAIKKEIEQEAYEKFLALPELKEYMRKLNSPISLVFYDSSIDENDGKDEISAYAGYKVRFKDYPEDALQGFYQWETKLDNKGKGRINTRVGLLAYNEVKPVLELVSPDEKVVHTINLSDIKSGYTEEEYINEIDILPPPGDIAAVIISGQIYCSSPTYEENPYIMTPAVMAINSMVPNWVRTTRNGNKMHVECAKVESDENDVPHFVPGTIATFDIIDFDSVGTRKAKIENLVIDNQIAMTSGEDDTPIWMEYYKFSVSSQLPMIDETTIQSDDEDEDFGDIDAIGAKSFRVWSLSQAKGLKISNFNYGMKNWHYNWWTGELESEEEHVFSLNNNPANTIQVIVAFK